MLISNGRWELLVLLQPLSPFSSGVCLAVSISMKQFLCRWQSREGSSETQREKQLDGVLCGNNSDSFVQNFYSFYASISFELNMLISYRGTYLKYFE